MLVEIFRRHCAHYVRSFPGQIKYTTQNNNQTMIFPRLALAIAMLASSSNALATFDRRQVFGILAGSAAAATVAAPPAEAAGSIKTGPASVFTGDYNDPNHPECLRQVKVFGAPLRADGTRSSYPIIEITGYDGKGEGATCTERPTRADLWKIQGKVKSNTEALIDFSPKGGPANLGAKFEADGIVFPDGNKWTKVPTGTNNRRPVDMSTLKSSS